MAQYVSQMVTYGAQVVRRAFTRTLALQFADEPLFALNLQNNRFANSNSESKISINELMGDGFVWAVQKSKRSVEKRLIRRFGHPKYPDDCAIIRPKNTITVCDACGNYHEFQTLCGFCYEKVKQETLKIQEAIRNKFKNTPIEQEVAVVYTNERNNFDDNQLKDKRIVEMDRERPQWFSKNLLSKTTSTKWTEKNVIEADEQPNIKQ